MKLPSRYVRLCEHWSFAAHDQPACPGGVFLPDDTLIIERDDAEPIIAQAIAGHSFLTVGDAVEAAVRILDALSFREAEPEVERNQIGMW